MTNSEEESSSSRTYGSPKRAVSTYNGSTEHASVSKQESHGQPAGHDSGTPLNGDAPDLDSYLPEYGFKVDLDHTFPKQWVPFFMARPHQLLALLPVAIRYIRYYIQIIMRGKRPFLNQITPERSRCFYGVPLGGIGSGTIGRGFRGEFARYQMTPGMYDYSDVSSNTFMVTVADEQGRCVYQTVLGAARTGRCKTLKTWKRDGALRGRYCGLYPRSWTVYDLPGQHLRLLLRQVSPVVPGEYRDSCLPVGVFVCHVENRGNSARRVSVALTCRNGTGTSLDKNGSCWSEAVRDSDCSAVLLHHTLRGANITYCAAARTQSGVQNTVCLGFDPNGTGADLWRTLRETGGVGDSAPETPTPDTGVRSRESCVAVCSSTLVSPKGSTEISLALSWDMPTFSFSSGQHSYKRRYTRWFTGSRAAQAIASHALRSCEHWERNIESWQQDVLQDRQLPSWFKSALFNQLYYVADGGTVWIDLPEDEASKLPADDPRHEYGRFAYLESHEYRMYNTYDVHFYASWALVMLWPELQRIVQYDIAHYTMSEDGERRIYLFDGNSGVRKMANSVPHDLGDPEDEPFAKVNAYFSHDTNIWKDLNINFVLQVHRDFIHFGRDMTYLRHMWPVCCAVMNTTELFDRDGDGLIENDGIADQTYDAWIMHGPSAYCTSLWLAALYAMTQMAEIQKLPEKHKHYAALLKKAQHAHVEKMWNGSYYNFDSCNGAHKRSIMSNQLAGHWYLVLTCSHPEVFPQDCVRTALRTIYDNNVLKYCGGKMGAVNGMYPDGSIDLYSVQSEEMWTGVTYALAATMIKEGMVEEGFRTAEGVYRTCYEKVGLGYDTPESLFASGHYRAIGYMRPLSIWSMWYALRLRKQEEQEGGNTSSQQELQEGGAV